MTRRLPPDLDAVRAFREAVLERAKGRCQVCPLIITVDVDAGRRCTGWATEAHHMEPRGMGGHGQNDPANGIAASTHGHAWVESHRDDARQLGLLRNHGRPSKTQLLIDLD